MPYYITWKLVCGLIVLVIIMVCAFIAAEDARKPAEVRCSRVFADHPVERCENQEVACFSTKSGLTCVPWHALWLYRLLGIGD